MLVNPKSRLEDFISMKISRMKIGNVSWRRIYYFLFLRYRIMKINWIRDYRFKEKFSKKDSNLLKYDSTSIEVFHRGCFDSFVFCECS